MREPFAEVFRISTPSFYEINIPLAQSGAASYSLQSYVKDRVREVYQESRLADWSEDGAKPVGLTAMIIAEKLTEVLPSLAARPAVFAQKSGKISIQWLSNGPTRDAIVVSVDENGGITYAMSCGNGKKTHGFEIFSGSPPRDVLECVLHRFLEPAQETQAAYG